MQTSTPNTNGPVSQSIQQEEHSQNVLPTKPIQVKKLSLEESSLLIDKAFTSVVGQEAAKAQIKDLILGASLDGFLAPMLFVGPAGWGKSMLMGITKNLVKQILNRKTIYAERGDDLGSKTVFFEEILLPRFHQSDCVIFVDEAHEMKLVVAMTIRSLVEPNAKRVSKTIPYKDEEVTYNPLRNSFILGTNKIDLLDPALVSRLEKIELAPYSPEEMGQILFNALKEDRIQFNENSLAVLADCFRGSARDIIQWLEAIRRRILIQGKKTINKADVAFIIKSRKTFPKGLSRNELQILLTLEKFGTLQLKELASIHGCSPNEQNTNENHLRKMHFLTVEGKRFLTRQGKEYLEELREEGYIPKKSQE